MGGLHEKERSDDRDAMKRQIKTEAKRCGEEGRLAKAGPRLLPVFVGTHVALGLVGRP